MANIDNTLCFCDRALCATNFRCTRLQFREMGPIWQMRELSCKNMLRWANNFKGHYYCMWSPTCLKVPKCLTSVGKMKNQTFSPKPGFIQSWTKVLGTVLQYSYFSIISRFPLKAVHPVRHFLALLPPPTLYKVETRKEFWIHASNIVCGVREGAGPVWIGNAPEMQKCPKTFVHDCRLA